MDEEIKDNGEIVSKYRNIKTIINGISFHSKKEGLRYVELKQLEKRKKIFNLKLQPKYIIAINGIKICSYIADFSYGENGFTIVEDVKGFKTSIYRLKKKLMKVILGIEIYET